MDSSESVGLDNWKMMGAFVEDFINQAEIPNVRYGYDYFPQCKTMATM